MNDTKRRDDLVDEAMEDTFPASDPPSFMGGAAVAGPPPKDKPREPASTEITATDEDADAAKAKPKP